MTDTGCVPESEVPYDGIDQDCDGADLRDVDADGWEASRVGGDDCNDANAEIRPDAEETCGNLQDDDCDELTDEECAPAGAPDPGGLYWICGPPVGPLGAPVLAAIVVLLRRRA